MYDQHDTVITVSRAAIIRGRHEPRTSELFRVPLVPDVRNNNTKPILVKQPLSKYLHTRPPPQEAVFNIYELKTQPKLVQYLHAAARLPTKPTWLREVKNRQFASWTGLTPEAIAKHFPKSEETLKGHARKTKSGQGSTNTHQGGKTILSTKMKPMQKQNSPAQQQRNTTFSSKSTMSRRTKPSSKLKVYTDQTGRFPKKSSQGNQYIMVLVKLDTM
jgi:hypothetical protein